MHRLFSVALIAGALVGCGEAAAIDDDDSHPLCSDGDPARERFGTDCSCCHEEFGLSGSVAEGSGIDRVIVEDAAGLELDIAVNAYGNFFRHVELREPVRAEVVLQDGRHLAMQGVAHGACNECHQPGVLGTLGTSDTW